MFPLCRTRCLIADVEEAEDYMFVPLVFDTPGLQASTDAADGVNAADKSCGASGTDTSVDFDES